MNSIPRNIARSLARGARHAYFLYRARHAEEYIDPSDSDLALIEAELAELGVDVGSLDIDENELARFKTELQFPADYHGGRYGGVWDEKLLEHYIAYERLGLRSYGPNDTYVDIAACSSPWAKILRELLGIDAYAVDLAVSAPFRSYPYYLQQDATATTFEDGSVRGASLQCAFEMFLGTADIKLISELQRILQPGGACVIAPLYMHRTYCGYSTLDYFGRGFADAAAKHYVRRHGAHVPFSRKYDAKTLKARVLDAITSAGMTYRLSVVRNKRRLGEGVYCHFVLEVLR